MPERVPTSALDAALARVGDRWSLLIVGTLLSGPGRFNELAGQLPGIAPNILTDRLRRLERDGVVLAEPYSRRPVRLAYRLTEEGEELAGVLRLLAAWAGRGSGAGSGDALRHASCGSVLEAHWYCPTCARPVEEREGSDLRYV